MATFRGGMEFEQGSSISLLPAPIVMPSYLYVPEVFLPTKCDGGVACRAGPTSG